MNVKHIIPTRKHFSKASLFFFFLIALHSNCLTAETLTLYANNNSKEIGGSVFFGSCTVWGDPDYGFGFVGSEEQQDDIRQYLEFDIPSGLNITGIDMQINAWNGSTYPGIKIVSNGTNPVCSRSFYDALKTGSTYFSGFLAIGGSPSIVSPFPGSWSPGSKIGMGVSSLADMYHQYTYMTVKLLVHYNSEPDTDNDSIPDSSDNCPLVYNTDQINTDGDTYGNACDWDDDNDGVLDQLDAAPLDSENNNELDLNLNASYKGIQNRSNTERSE